MSASMADTPSPDRIDPVQTQSTNHSSHAASPKEDDDPWRLKIMLTLDGGGVRGYGSLLMLRELMKKVEELERNHKDGANNSSFEPFEAPLRREDRPAERIETTSDGAPTAQQRLKPAISGYLPCHYFDYIGGTSTGGLNAIMLGRLRMTADQCIAKYPEMARQIFSNPNRWQIKGHPKAKYDAKPLEDAINDIVKIRTKENANANMKGFKSPDDLCRTFVISKKRINDIEDDRYVFRSYDNQGDDRVGPCNAGLASEAEIWQAGRATTAAPTYFEPLQIGNDWFSDGGLGYNNPAEVGYGEALVKEGYYSHKKMPVQLFLSIGTGGRNKNKRPYFPEADPPQAQQQNRNKPRFFRYLSNLGHRLQKELTRTDVVDDQMYAKSVSDGWHYTRWTGGEDLAKLRLDKWKMERPTRRSTQHDIESWIETYMKDPIRVAEILEVAKILVDVRRRRISYRDGDKWQRYTYCSHLICQTCNTRDPRSNGTIARLTRHMQEKHGQVVVNLPSYARFAPKILGGPF